MKCDPPDPGPGESVCLWENRSETNSLLMEAPHGWGAAS
jgi:hypothetical protein